MSGVFRERVPVETRGFEALPLLRSTARPARRFVWVERLAFVTIGVVLALAVLAR